MSSAWTIYESPLGPLTLTGGATGLTALYFPGRSAALDEAGQNQVLFAAAIEQLEQYFAGERVGFDLSLELAGTPFQQRVWRQLLAVPYGRTVSYGELTTAIGRPDRVRAVAAAIGRTPTPIIIPCHRAIAANGDLTGYLGGLQRKQTLLDFEAAVTHRDPPAAVWPARQLSFG